MPEFTPIPNAAPAIGLVLRTNADSDCMLRITHSFKDCMFAMWVSTPAMARTAKRPQKFSYAELQKVATARGATWGRLALPARLCTPPIADSEDDLKLQASWQLISPLVEIFDLETNLARDRYEFLIRQHATSTNTNFKTLRRLLHRYFYFGRNIYALVELKRGKPSPTASGGDNAVNCPGRRGPKSILSKEMGMNDFVLSTEDINDMVLTLKSLLRKGPTTYTNAHDIYIARRFAKRHPEIYKEYIEFKRQLPISYRQFNYHVSNHGLLEERLAANLRSHQRNAGSLGSIHANGPGEIAEIDATGGRIHLVTSGPSPVEIGKPTIYLLIDRWSRFVLSVYMSLLPASYEELRQCLLIAFTSREKRFQALNVNIDDQRWPIGRIPPVICHDRGSEFIGNSMREAAAKDLRIELTPLPPYCPDGKAIVERMMRELKRRIAESGLAGVYADRPLDPVTKKVAKNAQAAAVHSLAEAYRVLIEIVEEHNNRPHSALKKKKALTQAGIAPVPKEAYLWGLKHISGLKVATFSDEEYARMLLATDTASIGSGVVRYKNSPYLPGNETAILLAKKSPNRAQAIQIRVDKSVRKEIFIVSKQGEWAKFTITRGAESDASAMTFDEADALGPTQSLLAAQAQNSSQVERVKARANQEKPKGRIKASKASPQQKADARANQTAALKAALTASEKRSPVATTAKLTSVKPEWMRIEEAERLRQLELTRNQRNKS